jgi:endonuclease III related protein
MIGAILTQNVSWTNARRAVENLAAAGLLDPHRLAAAGQEEIAWLIVPSRFYNQKAERIREFVRIYVEEYRADPGELAAVETGALRKRLLAVRGLGKETVDCILLYACDKPVFVVDAYTRRIFSRFGLLPADASYDLMQRLFSENLPADVGLYNDYHAQIVRLGNTLCRTAPACDRCPVRALGCEHSALPQPS